MNIESSVAPPAGLHTLSCREPILPPRFAGLEAVNACDAGESAEVFKGEVGGSKLEGGESIVISSFSVAAEPHGAR